MDKDDIEFIACIYEFLLLLAFILFIIIGAETKWIIGIGVYYLAQVIRNNYRLKRR